MKKHKAKKNIKLSRGMALLAVLFTVAFVSLLLLSFSETGKRKIAEMQLWQIDMQASFYARGAEIIAIRALMDHNIRVLPMFWEAIQGFPAVYPSDTGSVTVWVRDLQNCFNVNALASKETAPLAKTQLELLTMRTGLFETNGPTFNAKLKDWVDADSEPEFAGGAEGLDYVNFKPKRLTSDQPMADISEINFIEPLDPYRYMYMTGFCVYPQSEKIKPNLNTLNEGDQDLIATVFSDASATGLSESGVMSLIKLRPDAGWKNYNEIKEKLQLTDEQVAELKKNSTLMGNWYAIYSKVDINGSNYYFSRIIRADHNGENPYWGASSVQIVSRSNSITSIDTWPIEKK